MPRLFVNTAAGGYPVHVGRGLLQDCTALEAVRCAGRRVVVVSDDQVAARYGGPLLRALGREAVAVSLLRVPAGEGAKTLSAYAALMEGMLAARIGRDGLVVALGGGCVGDLAGFAAATMYRGVSLVQMPTTLLAQVDSSVGGKTGINAAAGKNLIGAFHQPDCVVADIDVLRSLPEAQVRAGYAEVYKAGLLSSAAFVDWLHEHGADILAGDADARIEGVCRSIGIKAAIVEEDERELGRRALLNLGHTFGHALEAEEGKTGALPHGFAVAVGLALAAEVSARAGFCPAADAAAVRAHLQEVKLPASPREIAGAPFDPRRLLERMAHDKKVRAGRVPLVLLRGVGEAFLCPEPDWPLVRRVLAEACAG